MRNLPDPIIQVLRHFELAFSEPVWHWATILLVGAILAPGKRTVTAALRVMGLSQERQFQNYRRVLDRARWSSRILSQILPRRLGLPIAPRYQPLDIGRSGGTGWSNLRRSGGSRSSSSCEYV